MVDFILDVNVELSSDKPNYPRYLMDDLRNNNKNVRLVRGGTKFDKEIAQKNKLRLLLVELSKASKILKMDNKAVDEMEAKINDRIDKKFKPAPKECDDIHIFALSLVSGCLNIITNDVRMARCRDKIRANVGHDHCPDVKIIQSKDVYIGAV